MDQVAPISVRGRALAASRWDIAAALIVVGFVVVLAEASRGVTEPLAALAQSPISLAPSHLPQYAMRTVLRMLAALALSLVFTFTYATLAVRSRRAEALLIPLLDILQSVPVLGFISVTVVFFMSLAPGRVLGAELASVFAIFTSQAWNMAFSFYQSLRTLPAEIDEASRCFHFSPWMKFWRVEVPFAMPSLVWNMMVSMSGGWFFVVASEAISVGNKTVMLPGIGSYIAVAIERRDLGAIGLAMLAMLIVILIYDQLLFRPLVVWADRMRYDQEAYSSPEHSWFLDVLARSRLVAWAMAPAAFLADKSFKLFSEPDRQRHAPVRARGALLGDVLYFGAVGLIVALFLWRIVAFVGADIRTSEVGRVVLYGCFTMVRVFVLIVLASLIWVPVGVLVGLNPLAKRLVQPVAQFMAAFPANLMFPVAVFGIVTFHLDTNIWLSPLMILGTQWYILFNVVAGAASLPLELRDIASNLGVRGWLWWRRVAVPAVLPYFVTGAITASGGSWNASIVAELVHWGPTRLRAEGLGAYIAQATAEGNYRHIVLGIAVMSAFVVVINRVLWRPLYRYAERKFRLG